MDAHAHHIAAAGPLKNSLSPVARAAYALFAAAATIGAVAVAGPLVLAAWLLPDVPLIGGFAEPGRLKPAAVKPYNLLHALPGPVALVGAGAITSPLVLGLGLVWLSHVTFDRAAGYGLRSPQGWQRA